MAMYHLSTKPIGRSSGRSAVASIAYRAGVKIKNEYDGVTHDYSQRNSIGAAAYRSGTMLTDQHGNTHDFSNKFGIIHSEIMLPANAPKKFSDRDILWNTVELSEKRKDARTAREVEISLPIEFTQAQNIAVTKEFVKENYTDEGVIADFSIHDKGVGNPHVHIMLATRYVDEEGFKEKNRELDKTTQLKKWRKSWADICNKHLETNGFTARIDHRTLKEQGIDREPMKYMGIDYKHKKKLLVFEKELGEIAQHEPTITSQEIRKIERQINQIEIAKADLLRNQSRLEELKRDRLEAKAKDRAEIDRQILHLETYTESNVVEIERKVEQFNRTSIRIMHEEPSHERTDRAQPNEENDPNSTQNQLKERRLIQETQKEKISGDISSNENAMAENRRTMGIHGKDVRRIDWYRLKMQQIDEEIKAIWLRQENSLISFGKNAELEKLQAERAKFESYFAKRYDTDFENANVLQNEFRRKINSLKSRNKELARNSRQLKEKIKNRDMAIERIDKEITELKREERTRPDRTTRPTRERPSRGRPIRGRAIDLIISPDHDL